MIITICSSASFYGRVVELEKELKKRGLKVKIPKTAAVMIRRNDFNVENYKTWFRNPKDYKKKTALMRGHFKKVMEADAILVVNMEKNGIPGYIGANVLMEMALAFENRKKIYILENIISGAPFEEEILGMRPVFLRGDIAGIRVR